MSEIENGQRRMEYILENPDRESDFQRFLETYLDAPEVPIRPLVPYPSPDQVSGRMSFTPPDLYQDYAGPFGALLRKIEQGPRWLAMPVSKDPENTKEEES